MKAVELQTRKLAIKAKETEELAYKTQELVDDTVNPVNASGGTSKSSKEKCKCFYCLSVAKTVLKYSIAIIAKSSRNRKKKLSRAAESHRFQRMKTTNYGRCKICDAYVYFWGFECSQVSVTNLSITLTLTGIIHSNQLSHTKF